MPQNNTKFSSFIGITLLLILLGFTVYISFFVEKPIEEEIKEAEIVENTEFQTLDSNDLTNLWKLKNLQTDSMDIDYENKKITLQINKNLEFEQYDSSMNNNLYAQMPDSLKEYMSEIYNRVNKYKAIINYGTLDFESSFEERYSGTLKDFNIEYFNTNSIDLVQLSEIGNLFLKYQIHFISTQPDLGNFTHIYLKDGREIFLIKKHAEIKDDSYKRIVKNANYLNDSTRIVFPE